MKSRWNTKYMTVLKMLVKEKVWWVEKLTTKDTSLSWPVWVQSRRRLELNELAG